MAKPIEANETETTNLTRAQLGAYVRKELQSGSVKSVQVYNKGKKEFTRSWLIEFDDTGYKILKI